MIEAKVTSCVSEFTPEVDALYYTSFSNATPPKSRRERTALGRRCLHHARPTSRPGSVLPQSAGRTQRDKRDWHSCFSSTFLFTEITECAKPKELCVISPKKVRRTITCTRRDAPCPLCQMSRGRVHAHKTLRRNPSWRHPGVIKGE